MRIRKSSLSGVAVMVLIENVVWHLKGRPGCAQPFQLLKKAHGCSVVGQEQGRHTRREGACITVHAIVRHQVFIAQESLETCLATN